MLPPETRAPIGIIGGSGLQRLLALTEMKRIRVETPFGNPSDEILLGKLDGVRVAFLQRHGPGHGIPPSHINSRANIAALRRVGCTQLLSMSTVGSLQKECVPGSFVIVDQFIDRTIHRQKTFFGEGLAVHVPFGDPTCGRMRNVLKEGAVALGLPVVDGGTYIVMEGPQFSTRAESRLYQQWGGTVIGMTAMPEAKLAREAEMCYAMVAMPTDYDCWLQGEEAVTAALVTRRMEQMAEGVNRLIEEGTRRLHAHSGDCQMGCNHALDSAIMTHPERRSPEMLERLQFVAARFGK